VPIFRPAAALYMTAAPAARAATMLTLGTFHERQGDQFLLDRKDAGDPPGFTTVFDGSLAPVVWGRVFGEEATRDGSGPLNASFKGDIVGGQLGLDLAQFHLQPGDTDHVGVFYAYSNLSANGHAFVMGLPDFLYGQTTLASHNAGAYWSHIGKTGWYLDAVLMGSFYSETPQALFDVDSDLSGHGITGSLEGAYPFAITDSIELETQGQIIWQSVSIDSAADPFTTVDFDSGNSVTGRFGLQLQDNLIVDGFWIQPRVLVNLWHTFDGNDTTIFQSVIPISAPFESTTVEMGGGMAAYVDRNLSTYAQITYTANVGGEYVHAVKEMIGARYSW
jgi:autotransporter family porin